MEMILPVGKVNQAALVLVLTDKVEPLPQHRIIRVTYRPMEEVEITSAGTDVRLVLVKFT